MADRLCARLQSGTGGFDTYFTKCKICDNSSPGYHFLSFLQNVSGMGDKIDKLALICLKDKKILCARSKNRDVFYVPGGKREAGESDIEALTREIKEELDVDIVESTLKYMETFEAQAHGKPAGTLVRITCYTGEYMGEAKPSSEVEEIAWLTYSEKRKVAPAGHLILDWLKERDLIAD